MPKSVTPLVRTSAFQKAVTAWFDAEGKDYPWRATRDPYAVLVSEMMLQQTQIATVLGRGYYANWLQRFPSPEALAKADESTVLKAWEGLGYYSRARNLHKAAKYISCELGGVFPETAEAILKLPGVGRYTAAAVATFAYGHAEPIVDANIARVLARLFAFSDAIDSTTGTRQLWDWAAELVPTKNPRAYNSGLMELGQQICKPRQADCEICPIAKFCASRDGDPEALPVKKPRTKTVYLDEHVFYACNDDGSVLLEQEQKRRRQGLWKFPAISEEGDWSGLPILYKARYGITHHQVTLFVHALEDPAKAGKHQRLVPADELDDIPMPSPYRKALIAIRRVDPIFGDV